MGFVIAAAVILLILLFRVGVRVRSDGDLDLGLDLGLINIPLYPKKDKKIKLSDYRIGKFRKIMAKQAEKERKKREKRLAKKENKKILKTDTDDLEGKSQKRGKRDIKGLISMVTDLARAFLSRFGKHLRIKVRRIVLVVGSEDAATTAVTYGAVCGAVQCFMELIDNCLDVRFPKSSEIKVLPDFTADRSSAEIDITFSFRVWQIFDMLIRTGIAYFKRK